MIDYQLLPPVYHDATKILKRVQGVKELGFRSMEYWKSGILGIDIVINGVTVFFPNTNALKITRIPEGSSHAVEYLNQIL